MRLSVVTPTLDEEAAIGGLVAHALAVGDEVVVSDGGSRDATVERARQAGARVVEGPPGRGAQLDRGCRAAQGDVLLVLHADTRLPPDAGERIRAAVSGGAVGGGFRVRFDQRGPLFRLGAAIVNLRTGLTRCPLGDQAQFATRAAYDAVGGYRPWPILEDLDFARRLKRVGPTVVIPEPATTAARRFTGQGISRTIATNWLIWALYFAGVPPWRLGRLYRQVR